MKKIFCLKILLFLIPSLLLISFAESEYIELSINNNIAKVNGKEMTLDAPPFISSETGRTLVPLRFISEAFKAEVKWNEEEKERTWLGLDENGNNKQYTEIVKNQNIDVTINNGTAKDLKYPITWYLRVDRTDVWNSNTVSKQDAFYDNAPEGHLASLGYSSSLMERGINTDQAPIIVNNRVMIPLRFIAEKMFQAKVEWNGSTKTIRISR